MLIYLTNKGFLESEIDDFDTGRMPCFFVFIYFNMFLLLSTLTTEQKKTFTFWPNFVLLMLMLVPVEKSNNNAPFCLD